MPITLTTASSHRGNIQPSRSKAAVHQPPDTVIVTGADVPTTHAPKKRSVSSEIIGSEMEEIKQLLRSSNGGTNTAALRERRRSKEIPDDLAASAPAEREAGQRHEGSWLHVSSKQCKEINELITAKMKTVDAPAPVPAPSDHVNAADREGTTMMDMTDSPMTGQSTEHDTTESSVAARGKAKASAQAAGGVFLTVAEYADIQRRVSHLEEQLANSRAEITVLADSQGTRHATPGARRISNAVEDTITFFKRVASPLGRHASAPNAVDEQTEPTGRRPPSSRGRASSLVQAFKSSIVASSPYAHHSGNIVRVAAPVAIDAT